LGKDGLSNLEWVELGLREALAKDACAILAGLCNAADLRIPADAPCPGEKAYPGRKRTVETLFGAVELQRNYYYHAQRQQGRFALDQALGLVEGYSPALARLLCRAAARSSFQAASADLLAYAGVQIQERRIPRLLQAVVPGMQEELDQEPMAAETKEVDVFYVSADGTGVPMRKAELENRPGRQADGSAKTREVKLGVIFTQQGCDAEGQPLRDPNSCSYAATFQEATDFGTCLRREAFRRGFARANEVVFIGDGAAWIWELARINFPDAIEILDFYHAAEHLGELCAALYGQSSAASQAQRNLWQSSLKEDGIDQVLSEARAALPRRGPRRQAAQKQIAYFEKNRNRMLYATFRALGYFIGSGVVEAGCRTLIGQRLKQSGMFWSIQGAQNVISLRSALLSNRFDPYWDRRNSTPNLPLQRAA
jgi:hypothetical protein